MFRVNVTSRPWSGTSAQQSVGDRVKTSASSRRSNQSQQKQRHKAGTEDHEKPMERSFGISKTLLYTASDCNTEFGRFRCARLVPVEPIVKGASGIRDTSSQNDMKCDADLHKNLHASVMLIDGAAMLQEIGEYTAEDGTVSIIVSLGAKPAQAEGKC